MFTPPRCPNLDCPQHHAPQPDFFLRNGHYHPLCRAHAVPRFRCRACKRGFSRQTFRMDYRDHRPDLNDTVLLLLGSGLGLRQTSRITNLSLASTQQKFRKIARHLRDLNLNMRGPLKAGCELQFDELETYEGRRNTRPLTLPVLIEARSRFIIWAESAPIRPRGKMTEARRRAIAREEAESGPRVDRSEGAIRNTLEKGARLAGELGSVVLNTDEKSTYPKYAADAFGQDRLVHGQTSSKLPRTTWNPLFAINHTEAMARDLVGRLRRESWLVSKKGKYLDLHMQLHMSYRNYVRKRFNYDRESPAQVLGFVDRRLRPTQLLSWRQDWGTISVHPLARSSESVAQWMTGPTG